MSSIKVAPIHDSIDIIIILNQYYYKEYAENKVNMKYSIKLLKLNTLVQVVLYFKASSN